MNKFKFLNVLVMFALALLMTACPPDPKEPKEIYGTFSGTATRIITSLSTSEEIINLTESATLSITKMNDKMNVMVEGESTNFLSKISGLPILNVAGDKNYKYSFKASDGSVEITILSSDFDNVTYDYVSINEEEDVRVEMSFKGRRI